jgi:hypothetical protein
LASSVTGRNRPGEVIDVADPDVMARGERSSWPGHRQRRYQSNR